MIQILENFRKKNHQIWSSYEEEIPITKMKATYFLSHTLHNTHIFLRKKVTHLIFFKISNILWFEHDIKSMTISISIL